MKIFVTLFSGTVRPRRLKLGTHVDSGQMYRVYQNQAAAAYLSLYFSFFFLSNFQTLKFFVTLCSGTVRPRRLKLGTHVDIGERGGSVVECRTPEREVGGSKPTSAVLCPWARHFTPRKYWLITQEAVAPSGPDWKIDDWDVKPQHKQTHMDSGQMYRVYQNQAAAAYLSLYFSFFFLSNFQTLKFFVILCSGTVRPRRLKLVTHVVTGWLYHAAALIHPFIFFIFSPIFKHKQKILSKHKQKILSHFTQELWGLEDWNLVHTWTVGRCSVYTGIRLLLTPPFILSFFFLSNIQALNFFVTLFSGTVRPRIET